MSLNVVINDDVALELLTSRNSKTQELFKYLKEKGVNLWYPIVSAPDLCEKSAEQSEGSPITSFFDSVKILSAIGNHWKRVPETHPHRRGALISLAAAELPGKTVIWSNDSSFESLVNSVSVVNSDGIKEWVEQGDSQVPFIDLGYQQLIMREELEQRIFSVLSHGQYILGPEIKELEKALKRFVGTKHAIVCSSGTDALLMPLMAWGIGPGDAVFTAPFTFVATAEVVSLIGATPVFVDIDPQTFNIDPIKLEASIEEVSRRSDLRPRAIIPVDLFGLPADYVAIWDIAKRWNLPVLEDAAQSFGALYHGKRAGSLGTAGATSFFPAKPLGCYGDGGAVFTNDDQLAEKLLSIRVHGKGKDKYDNVRTGLNARLDTIQAAILLTKLKYFAGELEKREKVARMYSELLTGHVKTPHVPDGLTSAWAQYSILLKNEYEREQLINALKKDGIPTAIYYPKPLHIQEAFVHLGYKMGDFPVSEDISKRILSLPMHPYLADKVEYIAEKVVKCVKMVRGK